MIAFFHLFEYLWKNMGCRSALPSIVKMSTSWIFFALILHFPNILHRFKDNSRSPYYRRVNWLIMVIFCCMFKKSLEWFCHKKFDKLLLGCYILGWTSIKLYRKTWVTQKNIEVEENRALKKEELREKLRTNNIIIIFSSIIRSY